MILRLNSNSGIFSAMGLQGIDIAVPLIILFVLFIVLSILLIVNLKKTSALEARLKSLTKGKNAASLESEITDLFKDTKQLGKGFKLQKYDIEDIRHRMLKNICKIGIVKYDAFHQMGGQLSYALCLLDEEDNGFILNSVQSADSSYTYLKEVTSGVSRIELGKEEVQALAKAMDDGYDE